MCAVVLCARVALADGKVRVIESDRCWAILDQVYFARDDDKVPDRALPILQPLVQLLQRCPKELPLLTLRGGIDQSERDATLSQRRADAVKAKLVELGIAADRLRVEATPLLPASCHKASCRDWNRRVWIGVPLP